jgi:hypothetical protein
MPHAQGSAWEFNFETCDSPAGKGIPIQKASGAVNMKTTITLKTKFK